MESNFEEDLASRGVHPDSIKEIIGAMSCECKNMVENDPIDEYLYCDKCGVIRGKDGKSPAMMFGGGNDLTKEQKSKRDLVSKITGFINS